MDHLIPTRRPNLVIINKKEKKKKNCIVDFIILAENRVKIKENDKRGEYLDLARELRIMWNMRGTVIASVNGTPVTVSKGLERELEELEIEGRLKIIQTTALRSAKILRKVLET